MSTTPTTPAVRSLSSRQRTTLAAIAAAHQAGNAADWTGRARQIRTGILEQAHAAHHAERDRAERARQRGEQIRDAQQQHRYRSTDRGRIDDGYDLSF